MKIYIDGACSGNPGKGKAVVCIDKKDCTFIPHDVMLSKNLGKTTNNQAEYYGLLLALDWIEKNMSELAKEKQTTIYTDSKLIEGHMNQGWKINKNTDLVLKAKKRMEKIKKKIDIRITWLPREVNKAGIKIENGEI